MIYAGGDIKDTHQVKRYFLHAINLDQLVRRIVSWINKDFSYSSKLSRKQAGIEIARNKNSFF